MADAPCLVNNVYLGNRGLKMLKYAPICLVSAVVRS